MNCTCDCMACSSNSYRPEVLDHNYNQWKCIALTSIACFFAQIIHHFAQSVWFHRCHQQASVKVTIVIFQTCFHLLLPFLNSLLLCVLGLMYISDNKLHSNNHVNHCIQQILKHYDASMWRTSLVAVLTVCANNCSQYFKFRSRYQLGYSVSYVNKSRRFFSHLPVAIDLFFGFNKTLQKC